MSQMFVIYAMNVGSIDKIFNFKQFSFIVHLTYLNFALYEYFIRLASKYHLLLSNNT